MAAFSSLIWGTSSFLSCHGNVEPICIYIYVTTFEANAKWILTVLFTQPGRKAGRNLWNLRILMSCMLTLVVNEDILQTNHFKHVEKGGTAVLYCLLSAEADRNLSWCCSENSYRVQKEIIQMQKCPHSCCRMPSWLMQNVQLHYFTVWSIWCTSKSAWPKLVQLGIAVLTSFKQAMLSPSAFWWIQSVFSGGCKCGRCCLWGAQKHFNSPDFKGWEALSGGARLNFVIRFT